MGAGQSARKLTISNEEEVGVIKVSNAIVQRLAQRDNAETNESAQDIRSSTQPNHASPPNAVLQTAPSGYPVYYYPELTMSALQIQQQKEQELKQQDQYWQKRLKNIEENYQKINRILEDEYKKAVSETVSVAKAGEKAVDSQDTMQPCLENSNKVLKCYQDHPKETLKCSDLVEKFSNCVWNVHYTRVIEARS